MLEYINTVDSANIKNKEFTEKLFELAFPYFEYKVQDQLFRLSAEVVQMEKKKLVMSLYWSVPSVSWGLSKISGSITWHAFDFSSDKSVIRNAIWNSSSKGGWYLSVFWWEHQLLQVLWTVM